jgi:hypothetical protein
MVFGLVLLAAIAAFYWLFIEGWLWRLILGAAGWFGIWIGLQIYYPASKAICGSFNGYSFSWAAVIPTVIVILAMAYTRE